MEWLTWIKKLRPTLVGVSAFLFTCAALANPVLNNIGAGSVTVQQTPSTTTVNQSSQRAILNWQSFNIGAQEATHFQQPAGGVALNRINATQGPSSIFGSLTATGQIILVNPAGIFFGPGSYVNVGGIIATTANITDKNFMQGNYQFDKVPGYSGSIINEGQIIAAQHGLVALVAPGVINKGVITANLGNVVLASGEAFTISFSGDSMVNFAITQPTTQPGLDQNGKPLRNGVSNTGKIFANGGKVLVTAQAAQGVLDNVINMQGVAEAKSVGVHNGEIILSGDPNGGVVRVASKINASGKQAGQKGGNVTVTGHNILIDEGTTIDVSGDIGGGNIRIGGNYKGQGPLPNANATVMAPNSTLIADAITYGNGGEIILWSNNATKAYGSISSRGGALSGNGGFIETSGKEFLDVADIKVDTRAPYGKMGTWLLDPRNVTINAVATTGGTFNGANPNVFTPTADDATVLNTTINTNLATSNVTISAGSSGAQAGNITVAAPITWTSTNTLLLDAAITTGTIVINAAISGINGSLNLRAGALANTITTGALGTINVANFNLLRGTWSQVNAALPTFNVTNNFQIDSGAALSTNARFLRATGGTGTIGSPYQIVDVYGLQGIGSTATSLADNYVLMNNISASLTANWNNGAGFVPLGDGSTNFSGRFNGQHFAINDLFINRPNNDFVGLFGSTLAATIQNIGLNNVNITGGADTGGLIGAMNGGTVTQSYTTGSVSGNNPNSLTRFGVGGLVGDVLSGGAISLSYSGANATSLDPHESVGGLVGALDDFSTITNSYAYGNVTGTLGNIGGLVGSLAGPVTNVYSSGSVIRSTPGGGLIGSQFFGGSVTNGFFDNQTSGQTTSAGGTGLTTFNSTLFTTYNSAGWNITNTPSTTATTPGSIWFINDVRTRPILLSEFSTTITNAHQLELAGSTLGASYTLANDIDLAQATTKPSEVWAGNGFAPIANIGSNVFTGTFNGQNFAINNLSMPGANVNGLFSRISGATIQNLRLNNVVRTNVAGGPTGFLVGTANGGLISNVSVQGSVTASGGNVANLGGIVGTNNGATITNSTADVNINISGAFSSNSIGGLVGFNSSGTITNSYTKGSVITNAGSNFVGGLVGTNGGTIMNSYSTASVTAGSGSSQVGGLVGSNAAPVSNSYSTGIVSGAGSSNVGGLIGLNSGGTITNSFWNTQTSGIGSSSGGTGLTTAQMMNQASFTGFDFVNVWNIIPGQSYPFLRAFYSVTPRAFSGTTTAGAAATINLASGGSIRDSITTGADQSYYFLEGNNIVTGINNAFADNTGLLFYIGSGAVAGNNFIAAPTGGGSLANLNIIANQLNIGSTNTATIANSDLGAAVGAIVDLRILFSVAGNNLTIGNAARPNIAFTTSANTTYNADGTIGFTPGGVGALTFNGPVTISGASITSNSGQTYNGPVTLNADTILNSGANPILFNSTVGGANNLTLQNTGSSVTFNNNVNIAGLSTIAQAYSVALLGASNSFTNPVTFLNTGGVTLGDNGDVFNFNGGLSSLASTTNLNGTINTTNTAVGLGPVVLTGNSIINVGNGTIALGTVTGARSLDLTSNGTTFGGVVNIASLSSSGTGTDVINTPTITTTGNQIYNKAVTLNTGTALTGASITFANGINGNQNLALNANTFSITGPLVLNNASVVGTGVNNPFLLNTAGAQNWLITAANTGSLSGIAGVGGTFNFSNIQSIIGGSGSDTFTLNTAFSGSINGGAGSNSLTALNIPNTWTITGVDTGSLASITGGFSNIQNLIGGSATDDFILAGGTLTGSINGGGGTDSLTADNVANTWSVTGLNAGSVTGVGGGFSNIQNLIGGNLGDTFTLAGGTLTGSINGGGGTNSLTADNVANTWSVTGLNAGSVTGVGGGFSNIQNLIGGSLDDAFILAGGTLTGLIDGSGGNNSLTGNNVANTWTITSTDAGSVTGVGSDFSNIQNLIGGSAGNNFVFNGGNITGSITGGSGDNSLTGGSGPNTWVITGSNAGSVTGLGAFNSIGNLIGGNGDNSFILSGGTLSGSILGGSGINTLTGNNANNAWSITGINTGNVTGLGAGFGNIQNVIGGTGADLFTLAGGTLSGTISGGGGVNTLAANTSLTNTWGISGTDKGIVTGTGGFNNIQNLIGGNNGNTFAFANDSHISGSIYGGALTSLNTLEFLGYTSSIKVNVLPNIFQGAALSDTSGLVASYVNINNLVGNGIIKNTLTLPNKQNSLTITGAQSGYINDPLFFSGFNTFVSTSGIDTVNFLTSASIDSATQSALVGGSNMFFTNFNLGGGATVTPPVVVNNDVNAFTSNVSSIIEQPVTREIDTNGDWLSSTDSIEKNLKDIVNAANKEYNDSLNKVKINPYCTSTGG